MHKQKDDVKSCKTAIKTATTAEKEQAKKKGGDEKNVGEPTTERPISLAF